MNEEVPARGELRALLGFSSLFNTALDGRPWDAVVLAGDRHGSYVWEAVRRDRLNRFILLGMSFIGPSEDHTSVSVDGYFGADDGYHYRREHIEPTEFPDYTSSLAIEGVLMLIRDMLDRAEALEPDDLTDTYITPRAHEPNSFPRKR